MVASHYYGYHLQLFQFYCISQGQLHFFYLFYHHYIRLHPLLALSIFTSLQQLCLVITHVYTPMVTIFIYFTMFTSFRGYTVFHHVYIIYLGQLLPVITQLFLPTILYDSDHSYILCNVYLIYGNYIIYQLYLGYHLYCHYLRLHSLLQLYLWLPYLL